MLAVSMKLEVATELGVAVLVSVGMGEGVSVLVDIATAGAT